MDRRADTVIAANNLDLVRQVFGIWATQERGQLLDRVLHQRHLKQAFQKWRAASAHIDLMQNLSSDLRSAFDTRLKGQVLGYLHTAVLRKRQIARRAGDMDRSRIIMNAFTHWREAKKRLEEDVAHAHAARAFFVQRMALVVWKVELAKVRQERFVLAKEEELQRGVLARESYVTRS